MYNFQIRPRCSSSWEISRSLAFELEVYRPRIAILPWGFTSRSLYMHNANSHASASIEVISVSVFKVTMVRPLPLALFRRLAWSFDDQC